MMQTGVVFTSTPKIQLGIDVLDSFTYDFIKNKNCALLTNFAGRSADGKFSVEILKKNPDINLIALLTPEHGFYTTAPAGKHIANDSIFGLPAYSLYNKSRKPSKKILDNIDIIIIDLQDIGVRSYTYISTMYKTMQAAAQYDKTVVILDRPNPLGGLIIDGNIVEEEYKSFVSIIPVAYIHACTIGELAYMINGEGWLKDENGNTLTCDLKVIKMRNWRRDMLWEDTGLKWYPTSPHIPTVDAVRGLATFGIFGELGFISIGIGTTFPFQVIGSPTMDYSRVDDYMNFFRYRSFHYSKMQYQPYYAKDKGKKVTGWYFDFTGSLESQPYQDGIRFFLALRSGMPELFVKKNIATRSIKMFKKVTGTSKIFDELFSEDNVNNVLLYAREGVVEYKVMRNKYLLY